MPRVWSQVAKIDYLTILENAWQKHLAPREDGASTMISTFAGCGGSSLGYSIAGFEELLAVEWNDNAVSTFKLNFSGVPVYHGDIAKLSVNEVFRITGINQGELDILDGSPPCQGFSTAGKRCLDDDRNQLFREYVRLLRGIQPKVFVMENVSGMVKGKMKLIFVEILRELKSSGYDVSARLMNAMYFNVPQSRQRLIFIGVRNDLGIKPTHPLAQNNLISLKDAIFHLEGTQKRKTVYNTYAKYLQPGQKSCDVKSMPTKERDIFRCYATKPSPTIIKRSNNQLIHYKENRPLSLTELSLLCSFPPQYKWNHQVNERLGNCVPPLFMAAIAKHIKNEILDKIKYTN